MSEQDDNQPSLFSKGTNSRRTLDLVGLVFGPLVVIYFIFLAFPSEGSVIILNGTSLFHTSLIWGSIYLSIGLGLTLTYKIQKFANFAHGEYFAIGGYTVLFLSTTRYYEKDQFDILPPEFLFHAIILGFLVSGVVAVVADKLVFRQLREKQATDQTMMISSLGLSLVLRSLIQIRFGAGAFTVKSSQRSAPTRFDLSTLKISIPLERKFLFASVEDYTQFSQLDAIFIVTVFLMVLVFFAFLKATKVGTAMRAVASNPDLAASSGVNVERIHTIASFIAGGMAGVGGALFALRTNVRPDMGLLILLPAFAVIILGTVGSLVGALLAAYIIGFTRVYSETILNGLSRPLNRPFYIDLRNISPFIVLIGILMFKPTGIGEGFERKFNEINLGKLFSSGGQAGD